MVHSITLRREDGSWIGNVVLEYDDGARWGRLYSITDYGDYAYQWRAVPRTPTKGFEAFVRMMDADYMMDKLSCRHDEAMVYDTDKTMEALQKRIMDVHCESEGADYLGNALSELDDVETERELWAWQGRHADIAEPDDIYACVAQRRGRMLLGYQSVVIPALQAYLREETGDAVG